MYVDFSQDRQGRLVLVRTVAVATCIKIKSQVAQRNEGLIACSHVSSTHLKRKAAYTPRGRNVLYMIYEYKWRTCNIGLVITQY